MKFKRRLNKDHFRLAVCSFSDGTKIKIWHKLPDTFGMSVNGAIENWLVRTNDFTAQSLVDYINSKMPDHAFTEEGFEKYRKKIKDELN